MDTAANTTTDTASSAHELDITLHKGAWAIHFKPGATSNPTSYQLQELLQDAMIEVSHNDSKLIIEHAIRRRNEWVTVAFAAFMEVMQQKDKRIHELRSTIAQMQDVAMLRQAKDAQAATPPLQIPLCDQHKLFFKPGVPYIFMVHEDCAACAKAVDEYNSSAPQHNYDAYWIRRATDARNDGFIPHDEANKLAEELRGLKDGELVQLPKNEKQARMMAHLGTQWLHENNESFRQTEEKELVKTPGNWCNTHLDVHPPGHSCSDVNPLGPDTIALPMNNFMLMRQDALRWRAFAQPNVMLYEVHDTTYREAINSAMKPIKTSTNLVGYQLNYGLTFHTKQEAMDHVITKQQEAHHDKSAY